MILATNSGMNRLISKTRRDKPGAAIGLRSATLAKIASAMVSGEIFPDPLPEVIAVSTSGGTASTTWMPSERNCTRSDRVNEASPALVAE